MTSQPASQPAAKLDRQALLDIVNGACVLGSGGGGPLTLGMEMVEALTAPGAPAVSLVVPEAVPDGARMAISAAFGSPDAAANVTAAGLEQVAVGAFAALETLEIGTPFTHVLLGEIGAGNALIPMLVAQAKNLPIVDASGAPRAMPLLANCVFADQLTVSPLAFSNGEQTFGVTAPDAKLADEILRGVVSAGGAFPQLGGLALWSMSGSDMKRAALPGTLTRAWKLGEALRTAPAGEKVQTARHFLGGVLLFEGDHLSASEQTGGGFDVNTITLRALDRRCELVIYGQNENLIAWRSDRSEPIAMAPDLICYVTEDGRTFSNATPDLAEIHPSTKVAVIGVPAASLGYATKWVIASFAKLLSHLGYPGPYRSLVVA
ncbi:MAG: DUF917 domain-containing protein [Solirubrobacteraceae bacterium]